MFDGTVDELLKLRHLPNFTQIRHVRCQLFLWFWPLDMFNRSLRTGMKALLSGKSGTAMESFMMAAEEGCSDAYLLLALLSDKSKKSDYLVRAAESGNPVGIYETRSLEEAANAGYAKAVFLLADKYELGKDGYKREPEVARNWYIKAADRLYRCALLQVAQMYERGELGVGRNLKKAAHYKALYLSKRGKFELSPDAYPLP